MAGLAWPVILAEIGWIAMGVVDVVAVGPLGPAAIGAVGIGTNVFMAFMVFGMGTLFALDTFVSQAFGGRRIEECRAWLVAGVWTALALGLVLTGVGAICFVTIPRWGMSPEITPLLRPYFGQLLWSALPLLLYTVLRRYLQALAIVKPVMVAIVAANLVNALANWVLIYGHWGAPALGVVGAAWATLASRLVLAIWLLGLVAVLGWRERQAPDGPSWRPDAGRIGRIVGHGLPAALQIVLEVGAFAVAAILTARISAVAAGAHQIVMQIAGFFFMVPLGISSAAAVRVGHAVGRGDRAGARLAGWTAVLLAGAAALVVSSIMAGAPHLLLSLFTGDAGVVLLGTTVLLIWAAFQPFDALQTVGIGALRGIGDTRTPMLLHLAAHYAFGLPIGYYLAFPAGMGIVGLWTGLSIGLLMAGVTVLAAWHWRSARVVPVEAA